MNRNLANTRFVRLWYIFHKSWSSENERFVVNACAVCVCVCVCVCARVPACLPAPLFTIHRRFSQAAIVTELIGNDVVTRNRRFAELLRSTSSPVQGCLNSRRVCKDVILSSCSSACSGCRVTCGPSHFALRTVLEARTVCLEGGYQVWYCLIPCICWRREH
jgi:hypothetical protein